MATGLGSYRLLRNGDAVADTRDVENDWKPDFAIFAIGFANSIANSINGLLMQEGADLPLLDGQY